MSTFLAGCAAILVILLGLPHPGNSFDSATSLFIATLIYFRITTFRNPLIHTLTSILMILLFMIKRPDDGIIYIVAVSAGWFTQFIISQIPTKKDLIVLILVIFGFVVSAWNNTNEVRRFLTHEPVTETYRTDLDDFLKTYYLMERGASYYQAFNQAVTENAYKNGALPNLWVWRLPTVFYLWQLVPGTWGLHIFGLFIALGIIGLGSAYKIGLVLSGSSSYALLSSYFLYPYLHFAVRNTELMHTEWWAIIPVMIGLWAIMQKKQKTALIFFCLALSIRELLLIPFLGIVILLYLGKFPKWRLYIIPIVTCIIALFLHTIFIQHELQRTITHLTQLRTHPIGFDIIRTSLAFGSWEYYFFDLRLFRLFWMAALITVSLLRRKLAIIILPLLLFPLTFLLIGSSKDNDYWGVLYMPFVLILAPHFLTVISGKVRLYRHLG